MKKLIKIASLFAFLTFTLLGCKDSFRPEMNEYQTSLIIGTYSGHLTDYYYPDTNCQIYMHILPDAKTGTIKFDYGETASSHDIVLRANETGYDVLVTHSNNRIAFITMVKSDGFIYNHLRESGTHVPVTLVKED